jgi:hypothetical protein
MQDLISYLKVRLWLHMHGYDCALHIEDVMCLMRLGWAHAKAICCSHMHHSAIQEATG